MHLSVRRNNSLPDLEKSWKTPARSFFYLRLAYVCAYNRRFHIDGQFLSRRSHLLLAFDVSSWKYSLTCHMAMFLLRPMETSA